MSHIDDLIAQLCPAGVDYFPLSDVARIRNGKDHKALGPGGVPVYGTGGIIARVDRAAYNLPSVLIPRKGSLNKLYYVDEPFWTVDTIFYTEVKSALYPKFFYYHLQTLRLEGMNQAGGVPSLTQSMLNTLRVPVPPLEVQRAIVEVLDKFAGLEAELEAELEARKKQYAHYLKALLTKPTEPSRSLTLGDVGRVSMCRRIFREQTSPVGDVPFYKIGTLGGVPDAYISRELYDEYRARYPFPRNGDVLISAAGTIGRAIAFDGRDAYYQDSNIVWLDHDESVVLNSYLIHWYRVVGWATDGGTIRRLYNQNILRTRIAVPPLDEQRRIVAILDRFDALVNDISRGLPAELAARRKQYAHYRDHLLTFKEAT
jgi:type I restriction enzyme S subunit